MNNSKPATKAEQGLNDSNYQSKVADRKLISNDPKLMSKAGLMEQEFLQKIITPCGIKVKSSILISNSVYSGEG